MGNYRNERRRKWVANVLLGVLALVTIVMLVYLTGTPSWNASGLPGDK